MFSSNKDLLVKELKTLKIWYLKYYKEDIKEHLKLISKISCYGIRKTKKSLLELPDLKIRAANLLDDINNSHLKELKIIHNNIKKYANSMAKDIQNNLKFYGSINEVGKKIGKPLSMPKEICKMVTYQKVAQNIFTTNELGLNKFGLNYIMVGHIKYTPSPSFYTSIWIPSLHRKKIDFLVQWMDEDFRNQQFRILKYSIKNNIAEEKRRLHWEDVNLADQVKTTKHILQTLKVEEEKHKDDDEDEKIKSKTLYHSPPSNLDSLTKTDAKTSQQTMRPRSVLVIEHRALSQRKGSKIQRAEKKIFPQDQFFSRKITDANLKIENHIQPLLKN